MITLITLRLGAFCLSTVFIINDHYIKNIYLQISYVKTRLGFCFYNHWNHGKFLVSLSTTEIHPLERYKILNYPLNLSLPHRHSRLFRPTLNRSLQLFQLSQPSQMMQEPRPFRK